MLVEHADADSHHSQNQNQQKQQHQSTPRLHSAYINCVTLEPSTIGRLVEDAYRQLRSHSSSSGRRLGKRGHSTTMAPTPLTPHQTAIADAASKERVTEIALPETAGQESSKAKEEIHHQTKLTAVRAATPKVMTASTNLGTSNNGNELTGRRNSFNDHSAHLKSNTTAAAAPLQGDPHPAEDIVETSQSVVASFGRSLKRYFGAGGSAAVLVLDDAERLLTISAPKNTDGKANCLAELMLLPKVMRLNLTIVVISRYALLYGTRLDNIASLEKSFATLLGSVAGLTIQFPAYKEQQVMKKV